MERWLGELSDEEKAFIKRFVLASGSLKELARQYGVSYPTLRARLDRLIAKIKIIEEPGTKDPFRARMQTLVAEGQLPIALAREILREYDKTKRRNEDG